MNQNLTEVRGSDAIEILINDHTAIKDLLTRLESASGHARVHTLEQLKAILVVHNAMEEALVYPALSLKARKHAESMHLYEETASADLLLFELDGLAKEPQQDGFEAKCKKFVGAVREHIEDEEEKAFPQLREKADPAAMRKLNEEALKFRREFRFEGKPPSGRSETGEISG